ncbi:cytoplasmic protein [Escherichia coli]|nr:cytoplasmic protein [Escherichia coli]MCF2004440.1 cytoplasmic protein [Escherichia coli]MCF2013997.1 cytoplasmic protein [Escherichia coli]MCF6614397.1 cytoplasmic protein [Escherichia coli]MCY6460843.1 cytoplasmic protein [Escherichia coli]MCY6614533.1 cytoplasmic protein [Escherichia coli]
MMKPLKDEEAADGISRKQSQNAVYQTCATLAGGEALAATNADPTSVTANE